MLGIIFFFTFFFKETKILKGSKILEIFFENFTRFNIILTNIREL